MSLSAPNLHSLQMFTYTCDILGMCVLFQSIFLASTDLKPILITEACVSVSKSFPFVVNKMDYYTHGAKIILCNN